MFTRVEPFLLYSVSSVHAGSGSELGVVDLPIQRERHTGYPKIESSSLKGAIRSAVESQKNPAKDKIELAFGSEAGTNSEQKSVAGALAFSDARILLFPVRSLRGVFAYVTCPYVIDRLNHDLETYSKEIPLFPVPVANTVSSDLLTVGKENQVILEEYTYTVRNDENVQALAERLDKLVFPTDTASGRLASRLVVLSDDEFGDFVQMSTEVNARIKIDSKTGIVAPRALWYEENLPPETILYSFLFAGEPRVEGETILQGADEVVGFIKDENVLPSVFQLGGNGTLGKGMLRRIWLTEEGAYV
jgi:CRISPR-associated protein Cmr4